MEENTVPQGAQDLLDQWVATVATLDPAKASDLYAETGIAFWGTFGSYCRTTREQAKEYFDHFLDAEELSCSIEEVHWRPIDQQAAVAGGHYLFTIRRPGAPEAAEAKARFTFVFQQNGSGPWEIVEHHSSLFPEGAY